MQFCDRLIAWDGLGVVFGLEHDSDVLLLGEVNRGLDMLGGRGVDYVGRVSSTGACFSFSPVSYHTCTAPGPLREDSEGIVHPETRVVGPIDNEVTSLSIVVGPRVVRQGGEPRRQQSSAEGSVELPPFLVGGPAGTAWECFALGAGGGCGPLLRAEPGPCGYTIKWVTTQGRVNV